MATPITNVELITIQIVVTPGTGNILGKHLQDLIADENDEVIAIKHLVTEHKSIEDLVTFVTNL